MFSQQQVDSLTAENNALNDAIKKLPDGMSQISNKNKMIKETITNLQMHRMRDNMVFFGIPKQQEEDPDVLIKRFIENPLKPSKIYLSIGKIEHFRQKEMVKS